MNTNMTMVLYVGTTRCLLATTFIAMTYGIALGQSPAPAAPAAAGQKASTINDQTNYLGDRVWFDQDIMVDIEGTNGEPLSHSVCLPRRWILRGGTAYTANGKSGSSVSESGTHFILKKKPSDNKPLKLILKKKPSDNKPLKPPLVAAPNVSPLDTCNAQLLPSDYKTDLDNVLQPDVSIRVSSTQMSATPPNRIGLTYGALTVPFKIHLSGTHAVTGSASIGPYLGYRSDNEGLGFGLTGIVFVAASDISVPQASNASSSTQSASTSTQSLFGVSYGIGAVATIKGNFQLGVVLGADRVNSNADYEYNGKLWAALELGYSFLQ